MKGYRVCTRYIDRPGTGYGVHTPVGVYPCTPWDVPQLGHDLSDPTLMVWRHRPPPIPPRPAYGTRKPEPTSGTTEDEAPGGGGTPKDRTEPLGPTKPGVNRAPLQNIAGRRLDT